MPSAIFKRAMLISGALVQYSRPPAGLGFLAGQCENVGLDYDTLDINIEILNRLGNDTWGVMTNLIETAWDTWPESIQKQGDDLLSDLVQQIAQSQVDVVAITVLSYAQQIWITRFLQHFKKVLKHVPVIVGGPGVSVAIPDRYNIDDQERLFGQYLLENQLIDFYALGEGEIVFHSFLIGNHSVPGLNYAGQQESWQPQLNDLDIFPIPSYKKIKMDNYQPVDGRPRVNITGSRGCVRSCTFCDVGYLWKKFRYRSGQHIANEILQHHRDLGITDFWFNDSLINGSLKSFQDLLTVLIEYKKQYPHLDSLAFGGQFIIRPQQSHPESLYKLMAKAGVQMLHVGIESGSTAVRDHMQKKFSNEDIDYHMAMCERYKIKNYFLMMAGYLTETEQDFEMTLDMMRRYQKYIINETVFGMNFVDAMIILPNTPAWNMTGELQIHFENREDGYDRSWSWVSGKNPSLTFKERLRRVAVAATTAMELGYPLPGEFHFHLERQYNIMLYNHNKKQQVKVIPIFS
jgi:radical SAM superfamily enzyme YgiQ (UPF0313 family)